jgi:hypothetical protein
MKVDGWIFGLMDEWIEARGCASSLNNPNIQ